MVFCLDIIREIVYLEEEGIVSGFAGGSRESIIDYTKLISSDSI
jgi:hypothetical protein